MTVVEWRGMTAQYGEDEISLMAGLPEGERLFIHGLKGLFDAQMEEIFPCPDPPQGPLWLYLITEGKVSRGWAQDLDCGPPWEPYDRPILGLVAAQKFPDVELVLRAVRNGAKAHPEALWVFAKGRGDVDKAILQELQALDAQYVIAESRNKYWLGHGIAMLAAEMWQGCTQVVAFHTPGSQRTQKFAGKPRVHMVERGEQRAKPKTRRRKAIA